jgi:hypothetical protein
MLHALTLPLTVRVVHDEHGGVRALHVSAGGIDQEGWKIP